MALDRKFTDDRHFGAYDGGKRDGPGCAKINLVHAHPGVALGAVGHDAIVAGEGEHGGSRKTVAVDGSDGRDCRGRATSHEHGGRETM